MHNKLQLAANSTAGLVDRVQRKYGGDLTARGVGDNKVYYTFLGRALVFVPPGCLIFQPPCPVSHVPLMTPCTCFCFCFFCQFVKNFSFHEMQDT